MAVHVGLLTLVLRIEGADSLKDKRHVIKGLLERARRDLHLSIAEVGFQNQTRLAEVAAAFAGSNRRTIERAKESAIAFLESDPRAIFDGCTWEWL
ncbi:MAG: DUF503 domain-containing protein [Fimbriimonadales bacterium]